MRRPSLYGALAALAFVFAFTAVGSSEAQAQTVCCVTPKKVWKTTAAQCKAAGGGPTNMSYCRDVCCVAGKRVWTTGDAQCRKEGGSPTNASYCRPVCCVKNAAIFSAIQVECYRQGGESWSCDRRLCCQWGSRRMFTSAGQCLRFHGRRMPSHYCTARVRPWPR